MSKAAKSKWINKISALESRADLIEDFAANHLIDADGLVYSSISEETRSAWKDEQFPDRVIYNCIDTPKKHWKADFFGYEDSNMATAEYLLANIYKYRATGNCKAKACANKSFLALKKVALGSAKYSGFTVKPMFGFLSKPYGGVKYAHESGEVSIDQYLRTMYAMQIYRDSLATKAQQLWINRFLVACAECWALNHYSFNYMLGIWRWGAVLPQGVAFGLYCSAIGSKLGKKPVHRNWYNIFLDRILLLEKNSQPSISSNVACLTTMAMRSLLKLDKTRSKQWKKYISNMIRWSQAGVDENGRTWLFAFLAGNSKGRYIKPHWGEKQRYWNFLSWRGNIYRPDAALAPTCVDAYELLGKGAYMSYALDLLAKLGEVGYLKWIEPVTASDLPRGYGVLGKSISGLNTVCWLRAYWQARCILKV